MREWNDEAYQEEWEGILRVYRLSDPDPAAALLARVATVDHEWLVFQLMDGNVVSVMFAPGPPTARLVRVDRVASRCSYPEALRRISGVIDGKDGRLCPACGKLVVINIDSPVVEGRQTVSCPLCWHQWERRWTELRNEMEVG